MTTIAAIDIGTARIKALIGHTGRWGARVDRWLHLPYANPALQSSAFAAGSGLYEAALPVLVRLLEDQKAELPADTQWRFTFNSLFARLHPLRLQSTSKRRLRIAADIYRDKLIEDGWQADYDIIDWDSRMQEGEALLYAWQGKPFDDLLLVLRQAGIKPRTVEFDALCLASTLEGNDPDVTRLLIDFGFSKTQLLLMRGNLLLSSQIYPRGLAAVCERVGQRLNMPLSDVEARLTEPMTAWARWTEMTEHELFEPFLLQVRRQAEEMLRGHPGAEVLVSGGMSDHVAFFDLLQECLGRKVRRHDPLPPDETVPWELHGAFCTAFGLFMRDMT